MNAQNTTMDDAIHLPLGIATRIALSHDTPAPLLDWMRHHGIRFFIEAGLISDIPERIWPAVGTVLGRAFWNHLPRPDNDFRPKNLPDPGRNDPCPCGSGRKFKHCCGVVGLPPMRFPEELLLPHVLELLASKDLKALPHRRFDPELLAAIARDWAKRGEAERARLLLEPLFVAPHHLDARHTAAFDTLMDLYLDLGRPRKRRELLAIGLAAADSVLRATARQRQAVMLIDAGDTAGAWAAFQAALRDNPDDPSLPLLEISLLQGEDKPEQLRERARYWAARLRRRPDAPEFADMIALLEDAAADPDRFAERYMDYSLPELSALARLLRAMPRISHPPRIELLDDGQGVVEDSLPKALYDEWTHLLDKAEADAILAWLASHAQGWDSLTVLDDLLGWLRAYAPTSWTDRHLYLPLFDRVRALADAALATLPQPPRFIAWECPSNQSWHRLLLRRAQWLARQGRMDEAMRAGEELLAWNPGDYPSVRYLLVTGYARTGRYAELLALAERYPEDLPAMSYNRALALFALDRKGEALVALAEAVRASPKPLKWLLKEQPKPASRDRSGIVAGGDYEAWLYREATLEAWRQSGALEWARATAPALKVRR